ncbi:N-acetylmuramoyl-L-alanine amidase [Cellulomonas biazotea]|uniref:Peptidoglycan recognition protein family domain-containing protein n=1 Tax=Cellulomonas biazotea TaxID=1709 RepID=A0A402DU55_9CELL|nr:N-acetylmuramoyl-L-alanine amidase [Cellulomonas biazotea]GCE77689.1 hypothetical protein CBZ_27450 [Cellulomonas biazotea]
MLSSVVAAATSAVLLAVPAVVPTVAGALPRAAGEPLSVQELDLTAVDTAALGDLPAVAPEPTEGAGDLAPLSAADATAERRVAPEAEGETAPDDAPVAEPAPDEAPAPDVLTAPLDTSPFSVLGVTWDEGPDDVVVRYRVRTDGTWSDWEAVAAADVQPDASSREASDGRGATDPIVALDADGVQLWAQSDTGDVTGLKAVLVDPGTQAADATVSAIPVPGQPAIVSRAGWGADESLRTCEPDYSSQMVAAAVHHTASTNSYSAADVPGLIRGFYAYHTRPEADGGRGWCDIGYNFLVDKFGRVFEGRAGGITSTVVGVHTGGFNSRTIGISAIGDYGTVAVPDVLTEAIASLIAWKFSIHGISAGVDVTMISGGGASKWPEGTAVTFSTIYGHRDAQLTSCPGQNLYNLLPYLRARVAELANPAVGVSPYGEWDSVTTTGSSLTVSGWAFDPETVVPITVEVRVDGALTSVLADRPRPDVAAAYPALGPNHGFTATIPHGPGSPVVCLAAVNVGNGTTVSLGCRRVTIRNAAPIGAVDSVTTSATGVTVSGWTLDPDTSASNEVHIYVDGVGVSLVASLNRPDVAAVYGRGAAHGFTHTRTLAAGEHSVCVYSIDTAGGSPTLLTCQSFTVGTPPPVVARTAPYGVIDAATATNTAITVTGWALDPDTHNPIDVHVYVDGRGVSLRADGNRPDVDQAFRKGAAHGWSYALDARPGPHDVCVHAINDGPGDNTLIGCRTVVVPDSAPIGVVDSMSASGGTLTVTGWALDPDTWASNQVHVYVDGVGYGLVADGERPDVAAVYGRGSKHGYTLRAPIGPGAHGVCVFSINTAAGDNTLVECRTVVLTDALPIGVVDSATTSPGTLTLTGWALDPDTSSPVDVHVYVDGVGVALTASTSRPDVGAVYGRGDQHGFTHARRLGAGPHSWCIHAIGAAGGGNTLVGCGSVVVP